MMNTSAMNFMAASKYMSNVKLGLLSLATLMVLGCASQQQQELDAKNNKSRARSHSDLGAVYLQERQYEIALEEFNIATKIDPSFADAYNGLGLVHSALGQDGVAEQNFKKAIQLEPNNPEARNNYGNFLCARNRIDESIKEFLEALKNPLYATPEVAYTNAGICSLRKQDTVNAEVYLQRALQINPLIGNAAYQLAAIQFKRNEVVLAKNTLRYTIISQPTPENLWLSVQIARKLGQRDEEASLALQLRRQYPDSEQAKLLASGK
jgi:type IV pilus assembly protein PilF